MFLSWVSLLYIHPNALAWVYAFVVPPYALPAGDFVCLRRPWVCQDGVVGHGRLRLCAMPFSLTEDWSVFLFIWSLIGAHSCIINRFGELLKPNWYSMLSFFLRYLPWIKVQFPWYWLAGSARTTGDASLHWTKLESHRSLKRLGSFNFVRINMDNLDMADVGTLPETTTSFWCDFSWWTWLSVGTSWQEVPGLER